MTTAKARPSIVFVNRVYPPLRGASGRVLRDLARAFVKSGWQVSVITTGHRKEIVKDAGIRVVRVKSNLKEKTILGYFLVWLKLYFRLAFFPKQDLIVTMTDPPMLVMAGRMIANSKGCHHIHWCQDLYPDLLPAMGFRIPSAILALLKRMSRRGMKSCERVIVIGRCMARHLTHTGIEPSRVTVIPNWPDLEIVRKKEEAAACVSNENVNGHHAQDTMSRELFRDASPKFRILYAGNIGRAHPMGTILEAAEKLLEHKEIEFVFVCDGPTQDRLARERDKRGLQNIKLLPYQPAAHLRAVMESGDLHLVTLKNETAGMLVPCKFYSALAVGRPCIYIGPQDTEIARVIKDFNAGTILPQGDGQQLARTILEYRNNGDLWYSTQQGAQEAGEIFVPTQSIREWVRRARDIVSTRPL